MQLIELILYGFITSFVAIFWIMMDHISAILLRVVGIHKLKVGRSDIIEKARELAIFSSDISSDGKSGFMIGRYYIGILTVSNNIDDRYAKTFSCICNKSTLDELYNKVIIPNTYFNVTVEGSCQNISTENLTFVADKPKDFQIEVLEKAEVFNTLLLCGPPNIGKSTCGGIIAAKNVIPLLDNVTPDLWANFDNS